MSRIATGGLESRVAWFLALVYGHSKLLCSHHMLSFLSSSTYRLLISWSIDRLMDTGSLFPICSVGPLMDTPNQKTGPPLVGPLMDTPASDPPALWSPGKTLSSPVKVSSKKLCFQ